VWVNQLLIHSVHHEPLSSESGHIRRLGVWVCEWAYCVVSLCEDTCLRSSSHFEDFAQEGARGMYNRVYGYECLGACQGMFEGTSIVIHLRVNCPASALHSLRCLPGVVSAVVLLASPRQVPPCLSVWAFLGICRMLDQADCGFWAEVVAGPTANTTSFCNWEQGPKSRVHCTTSGSEAPNGKFGESCR
jgi:hypothetical protein